MLERIAIAQGTSSIAAACRIVVIIPCYNEEITVGQTIAAFHAALPSAVIYVYDNNSIDCTAKYARLAGATVRHEARQGKGEVVRRMFADIDVVSLRGRPPFPECLVCRRQCVWMSISAVSGLSAWRSWRPVGGGAGRRTRSSRSSSRAFNRLVRSRRRRVSMVSRDGSCTNGGVRFERRRPRRRILRRDLCRRL